VSPTKGDGRASLIYDQASAGNFREASVGKVLWGFFYVNPRIDRSTRLYGRSDELRSIEVAFLPHRGHSPDEFVDDFKRIENKLVPILGNVALPTLVSRDPSGKIDGRSIRNGRLALFNGWRNNDTDIYQVIFWNGKDVEHEVTLIDSRAGTLGSCFESFKQVLADCWGGQ
jgi:hypothetical protein